MTLNQLPVVTVAIPTYNRIDLLKRALNSVLNQTYPFIEIIVSDNASHDGTGNYLKSLNDSRIVVHVSEFNLGMAANWQKCLDLATGKYFLLLSDDDYFLSNFSIELFVNQFDKDFENKVGLIFSDVCHDCSLINNIDFSTEKSILHIKSAQLVYNFFTSEMPVFPSSIMLRRLDLIKNGGFLNNNLSLAVDAYCWISILMNYEFAIRLNQKLIFYELHSSLSTISSDQWISDFKLLRKFIEKNNAFKDSSRYYILREITGAINRVPIIHIKNHLIYSKQPDYLYLIRYILLHINLILSYSNLRHFLRKYVIKGLFKDF